MARPRKHRPNALKLPPFADNASQVVEQLKEQIAELRRMKGAGLIHLPDGQSIDWQIAFREEIIRKAAVARKGERRLYSQRFSGR